MKVVSLSEAKDGLSSYVEEAQHATVLVTKHGKPAALLIGVEGEDFEDLMTQADPEFWKMIRERRKYPGEALPTSEMRARIASRK